MEREIAILLKKYEDKRCTRRELIQALALLGLGSSTAMAAPLPSRNIDHVSILVSDLQRSIDFYQRVFGLTERNRDEANGIVRLAADDGHVIVSLRQGDQPGIIDHFAITLEGTDREAVTRELTAAGLTPDENVEFGFYVRDPDGTVVQMWGV